MLKRLFLGALAAAALTACSSDDSNDVKTAAPRPITVEVTENPMTDDNAASARQTRGTIISTTSINEFYMYGDETTYTATKSSDGKWTTNPDYRPSSEDSKQCAFYGYSHRTINNGESSDPYISVTMDDNAFAVKDLLVAETTTSYNDCDGKVSLNFDHVSAAVDFTLKKSSNSKSITAEELKLNNVYKNGDYHFKEKKWNSLSETKDYPDYTINVNKTLTEDSQPLPTGTLFFIPQTLPYNKYAVCYFCFVLWFQNSMLPYNKYAVCYFCFVLWFQNSMLGTIQIKVTVDGTTTKTGTLTLNKTLEAGYHYNINIARDNGL